jgi:hypothetical protein
MQEFLFLSLFAFKYGKKISKLLIFFFVYIFWRARVCRPLLGLCGPFMIFEGCLDSNLEYCRSKLARYRLSHPSRSVNVVNSKDWLCSAAGPRKQPDQMLSGFHMQCAVSAVSASGENSANPWPRLPAQPPTAVCQPKSGIQLQPPLMYSQIRFTQASSLISTKYFQNRITV